MKTFLPEELAVNLKPIVDILKSGGLVVAPTDTSYGILVDATNRKAIEKLLKLKERPLGKAISVFVNGWPMMEQYVDISLLPKHTRALLPGSYTMVLPSLGKVSELVEAEDKTLGVRYIENSLINRIVDVLGFPVTATSANTTGKSPAYSLEAFVHQLSESRLKLIDAFIDAGDIPHNPPSTVIRFAGHKPEILRANTQNYVYHKLYRSKDILETKEIAGEVLHLLRKNVGKSAIIILLDGELGSGKTTWTKHFAELFGIQNIISPTYTYECEYPVQKDKYGVSVLRHFDLYNVVHDEDIDNLQLERCFEVDAISIIEWPAQINKQLLDSFANDAFLIRIQLIYTGETTREITVFHN